MEFKAVVEQQYLPSGCDGFDVFVRDYPLDVVELAVESLATWQNTWSEFASMDWRPAGFKEPPLAVHFISRFTDMCNDLAMTGSRQVPQASHRRLRVVVENFTGFGPRHLAASMDTGASVSELYAKFPGVPVQLSRHGKLLKAGPLKHAVDLTNLHGVVLQATGRVLGGMPKRTADEAALDATAEAS